MFLYVSRVVGRLCALLSCFSQKKIRYCSRTVANTAHHYCSNNVHSKYYSSKKNIFLLWFVLVFRVLLKVIKCQKIFFVLVLNCEEIREHLGFLWQVVFVGIVWLYHTLFLNFLDQFLEISDCISINLEVLENQNLVLESLETIVGNLETLNSILGKILGCLRKSWEPCCDSWIHELHSAISSFLLKKYRIFLEILSYIFIGFKQENASPSFHWTLVLGCWQLKKKNKTTCSAMNLGFGITQNKCQVWDWKTLKSAGIKLSFGRYLYWLRWVFYYLLPVMWNI